MDAASNFKQPLYANAKLSTWGASRAVRIPKKICETMGIESGDALNMNTGTDEKGPFIVIRPSSEHRSYGNAPYISMDNLFAEYKDDYVPSETDWGKDVGSEVIA